ncbi:MAG: haloalkane dehalogenase [Ktedonobacteraceae bacterium]|nr:haloalkane dehalogenase [Ktedonobacteraceae bacterium]
MSDNAISAIDPYVRKRVPVLDTDMAYVDVGTGDPIVFLHGNPTSSYLWRNIIPYLAQRGRCLAPDLVGMGDSGKAPQHSYRFVDHARYLDAWFEVLDLKSNITLVIHDWGSALGFYWAQMQNTQKMQERHPERIKAIVYMEALVQPVSWSEWPENARSIFQAMRSPAGEQIILEKNVFVERILPSSIIRHLSDAEMDAYRRPFLQPGESRRPTLTWPREIPIDGEPAGVYQIIDSYAHWLASSSIPKLFINAEPGSILTGKQREFCRTWPNQQEVTVKGIHFIQEDSPAEIGEAIATFLRQIPS